MKYPLLTLISLMCGITLMGQTLTLPTDLNMEEKIKSDNKYTLTFTFTNLPGGTTEVRVIDMNTGTANVGKDYEYSPLLPPFFSITAGTPNFSIDINVKKDAEKEGLETIDLIILYDKGGNQVIQPLHLTIAEEPPTEQDIDTSKWKFQLITGSNFSFFEKGPLKNFAGELKLWAPSITKKPKKHPLGFQFGLLNYQYYQSDSSQGRLSNESYLVDPVANKLVVGNTKYVTEIYALNSKVTFDNFGIYASPMIFLAGNKWCNLYADLHAEGIWRKSQTSYTKMSVRKDTVMYTSSDSTQGKVLQRFPGIRGLYQESNYFDFYIGVGLPFKMNFKNVLDFYADLTVGLTTFSRLEYQNITSEITKEIVNRVATYKNSLTPFTLFKFQMTTKVAPIDIVIGGEFRLIVGKQLDKYPAYKAVYLGAVLSLDQLIHK